ncbi:transmembrane amino acid transporter protein-domain-containing protein [Powellomyces hirtus]|nr:transmembrane amino acid transporter protein-domain-containing protein [Powellomyces hirtus]
MLSMAYTFGKLGPGLGTLLLLFFAILTRSSLRLLVKSAQKVSYHDTRSAILTAQNTPSYATLSRAAFGKSYAAPIVDLIMAFACFGFAVSYLQMIAEGVPQILAEIVPSLTESGAWILSREIGLIVSVAFLVLLVPLSFSRDVDDFKWFSGTAFICAVYLAAVVVWCAITGDGVPTETPAPPTMPPPERPWFILTDKTIGVLPIFVFLFTCHQNMFAVYNELRASETIKSDQPEDLNKIHRITDIAISVCFVIYLAVGWAGYLTFGNQADVMIINNYTPIAATTLARLSFVLLSAFSYPIQLHPCRSSLDSLLTHFRTTPTLHHAASSLAAYSSLESRRTIPSSTSPFSLRTKPESRTRNYLTIALLLSTHLCALCVPEPLLSQLLVFLGATCGSAVCYILPGMLFRSIAGDEEEEERMWGIGEARWNRCTAYTVEVLGALSGVLGVVFCLHG